MKKLKTILPKKSGRDASGKITVRHQGGRQKRFLREIDFKRDKRDIWGRVEEVVYDPNRNAYIALILYVDGERRYILAPVGLEEGQKIIASESAPLDIGCALPLAKIPVGSQVHNIEIRPGKGGQIVRGAGAAAVIHGKEEKYVLVKLPSSEIRRFRPEVYATLGQVGNAEARTERTWNCSASRITSSWRWRRKKWSWNEISKNCLWKACGRENTKEKKIFR